MGLTINSSFSSGSSKEPVITKPSLDPNQQGVSNNLANVLENFLKGFDQNPNQYMSGLTDFVKQGDLNPFSGPLGQNVIDAFERALSGEVSEEYYENTVAKPATTTFKEEIAPAINEQFVGPGTFWGDTRGKSVERQGMKLADSLAAARGEMANQALGRALEAALGYTGFMSDSISEHVKAYMAANPSSASILNAVMAYLGTPTQMVYQNPEYVPPALQDALKELT